MGAMEHVTCPRCRQGWEVSEPIPADTTCPTCQKLGDRSLVWYMQAMRDTRSEEERDALRLRFKLAEGRSWMRRDIEHALATRGAASLPPGVIQLAKEKAHP